MKKKYFRKIWILLLFLLPVGLSAQNVAINNSGNSAYVSAILDLSNQNTVGTVGFLPPYVTLTSATVFGLSGTAAQSNGLLVYNTSASLANGLSGAGLYYWNNTSGTWTYMGATTGWQILGNANIVDGTNFLGTTNDIPLTFKINSAKAGRIEDNTGTNSGANTYYGYGAGTSAYGLASGFNTAVGYNAANHINTGQYNTAVGNNALLNSTNAQYDVAVGDNSQNASNGGENASLGAYTLLNNSGSYNVAVGTAAIQGSGNGSQNQAIGGFSMSSLTNGNYNAAVGEITNQNITIGSYNAAFGYAALNRNVAGSYATAIGPYALYYANSTATAFNNYNVGVGYNALYGSTTPANNTGNHNTAIGSYSLYNFTSGFSNVGAGYFANANTNTGSGNVAIGDSTLITNTTGSYNTALGYGANVASAALTNATAIGNGASVSASNTMMMGNNSVTQFEFNGAFMPYYGAAYNAGTLNQVLVSQGPGVAPQWTNAGTISALTAWQITGNTGITASGSAIGVAANNNFIGTTNPADFVMVANGFERMRIANGTGNVGISNIAPTTMLQVGNAATTTGKFSVYSQDFQDGQVQIGNPTANGEASLDFISGVSTFGDAAASAGGNDYTWNIGAGSYALGGTKFIISNVATGPIMNFISPSGYVGIGNTTPQENLSINNGLNIDQANTDAGSLAGNPDQAITFGSNSGEGIGSQRTAGAKQYGLDFYTGYAERMTILNNGEVGIGTTAPAQALEVAQTASTIRVDGLGSAGTVYNQTSGVNTGNLVYANHANGDLWSVPAPAVASILTSSAAGVISWQAGSAIGGSGTTNYYARWTPNGTTLGIGFTEDNGTSVSISNPASAPVNAQMLTVTGNATSTTAIQGTTPVSTGYGIWGNNTAAAGAPIGVYGTANSASGGTGVEGQATQANGIGVEGYISGNTGNNIAVKGLNSSTGADPNYGVYGSTTGAGGGGNSFAVYGSATASGAGTTNYGGYFTASGAAVGNYGVVVPNGGGFSGFGITTPAAPVEVSYTGDVPYLQLNTTAANKRTRINFSQSQTVGMEIGTDYAVANINDLYIYNRAIGSVAAYFNPGNYDFLTARNTSSDFYLTNTGWLGLGTIAPAVPLDVENNQTMGIRYKKTAGGQDARINIVDNSGVQAAGWSLSVGWNGATGGDFYLIQEGVSGDVIYASHVNQHVGINTVAPTDMFDVNGTAGKPGGGAWVAFSDRRMKQQIQPYTDGLEQLLKINPVTYHYNKLSGYDTKPQYVGVIAQELKSIAPYMVGTFTKDSVAYFNVDNSAMTYMLINSVKEQQQMILGQQTKSDTQQAEIDALKKENEELKQKLDDLTNTVNQLLNKQK